MMSTSPLKRVAIIGAGPAGLVAAKTLREKGHFHVTVYEKTNRIGGIWALDEETVGGFLPVDTPVNLSRFTVSFSDLDWNEVNVLPKAGVNAKADGHPGSKYVSLFPKAWQVNRYLEEYRRRYLSPCNGERDCIYLNHEVTDVQRSQPSSSANAKWHIRVKDTEGAVMLHDFDYLVAASGFFSKPRDLQSSVAAVGDLNDLVHENVVPLVHSSRFRSLDQLLGNRESVSGKSILVFGGGNSSGEVAANIAFQLSDTFWSPGSNNLRRFQGCNVVHVMPRPLYALPPFDPVDEDSKAFFPLDLKLYDLSKRPTGPIVANGGRLQKEAKDMIHQIIQTMVGGDQSDLGSALVSEQGESRTTPYVALSESYAEYVRDETIEAVRGRLHGLQRSHEGCVKAKVMSPSGEIEIDNIAAVVYANGYTPSSALTYIPKDVKDMLGYDASSMRLPLILERWQTTHHRVPDVAFIGFYEGPYWGVMEMQARLTAQRWTDSLSDNEQSKSVVEKPFEEVERLRELRSSMQTKGLDVPQYWFGDYLGYMEEIAAELGLKRNDKEFGEREGIAIPARYLSAESNKKQADKIMNDLHKTWHDALNGRFVARAVMRAMHGDWDIQRKIQSKNAVLPSGTFKGTASFHPRVPTMDRSGKSFDIELLYAETGTFTAASGATMQASRHYVYRYEEENDKLSVWFTKPDRNLEVDYIFHDLSFVSPEEAKEEGACIAKADHLCVNDMYWTTYRLPIKGIALHEFELKHEVKGPSKDYVALTRYSRPLKQS